MTANTSRDGVEEREQFEGEDADQQRLESDAKNLIDIAKGLYGDRVKVADALDLRVRTDDNHEELRIAIAKVIREGSAPAEQPEGVAVVSSDSEAQPSIELNESQKAVVTLLKSNFDKHNAKVQSGIKFDDFEQYLKEDPKRVDKLSLLAKRGGELTVVSNKHGKYQLEELSAESPLTDRNMNYAKALEIAKDKYGAELMTNARYKALVKQGFSFNNTSYDWLAPGDEDIEDGLAFCGYFGSVIKYNASSYRQADGFRAALEV